MEKQGAESTVDRIRRDLDAILPSRTANNAVQHVKIEDSSKGSRAWNAFYLMLGLNAALLAMFAMHDRKIERMQDHLNAIYMMAPHLKPPEPKT